MQDFSTRDFRDACGRFATGITVITTELDGQRHGMTANGFMSVSLDPPLILVSIGRRAKSHALISAAMRFGVSILAEDQLALSNQFAGQHQPDLDIPWELFHSCWVFEGALAKFSTTVVDIHDAGDHSLFIARVDALTFTNGRPLLYAYTGYGQMKE